MKQIEDVLKLMHTYQKRTNKPLKTIKMSQQTFAMVRNEFAVVSGSRSQEFNGATIEFCTEAEEDMYYEEML